MNVNESDTAPTNAEGTRWKRNLAIIVVIFVGLAVSLRALFPSGSLNADEGRVVGVWTHKDDPGQTVIHFRADKTLRFDRTPFDGAVFMRWWIRNGEITMEYTDNDWVPAVVQRRVLGRVQDHYTINFEPDGEVVLKPATGKKLILIPWTGSYSVEIRQVP